MGTTADEQRFTELYVTDEQSCKNVGGIWANGYCGKFGKLSVPGRKPENVPTLKPSPVGLAVLECIRCFSDSSVRH